MTKFEATARERDQHAVLSFALDDLPAVVGATQRVEIDPYKEILERLKRRARLVALLGLAGVGEFCVLDELRVGDDSQLIGGGIPLPLLSDVLPSNMGLLIPRGVMLSVQVTNQSARAVYPKLAASFVFVEEPESTGARRTS